MGKAQVGANGNAYRKRTTCAVRAMRLVAAGREGVRAANQEVLMLGGVRLRTLMNVGWS